MSIERVPAILKIGDGLHFGPNAVRAMIRHGRGRFVKRGGRLKYWYSGQIEDLGTSYNLITTGGIDAVAYALGGKLGDGTGTASNIATGSGATSLTDSTKSWTTNQFIGQIVVAEESTNAPVHATIVTNTGTVLTVDGWRDGDDSSGTTPGTTANYHILAGQAPVRYMALTENASAASASNATLTGEITTGGCGRAICTFAHTASTSTYTLTKAFSVTASFPAIHRMGLFFHSTASTGPMVFETVLNADANVVNGDTLTVTETVTLS